MHRAGGQRDQHLVDAALLQHLPQVPHGADHLHAGDAGAHALARHAQAAHRPEPELPVQIDLLHHLPRQAAGAEHENVTEVVAAPAQRVEELLEEHPREGDSQEAQAGEQRERAAGVAGVADEVGGRDQQ